MIAILLRAALLVLPLVAVILWLRWRWAHQGDPEMLESELGRLRITLVAIGGAMLIVLLALRFTDNDTGAPRTHYVPPHSENGKVVPGRFEPVPDAQPEPQEDPEEDGAPSR
ncbi:MAG: hypothetical protein EP335_10970 [Alphaproteobacteria bacterium]|nr:MAG: hypothetical protein EP335_10970 [Alphaproteobacteria bacterium]